MSRLNVVYMHSHDTGRYVQPYGHAIATPNLQRLAGEGVLFRQMYCLAPTCSASRAALLTGQCPHSSGMNGLAHRGFSLYHPERHLAATLRANGYTTVLAGVQHVCKAEDVPECGYDITPQDRDLCAEKSAVDFLKNSPNEPFFLDIGHIETHRTGTDGFSGDEHNPKDGDGDDRYCMPPAPLPDTSETRRDMADFKTAAERLDRKHGMVLDALTETGLEENTIVIATTDHGIAFPAMKCNLTGHGTGVLFIMRGPGELSGGKITDSLVSHIDVYPTVCELLGIDSPEWLQGHSMMPLIRGEVEEINDEIHAEVTWHASFQPMRSVRTKRWRYIQNYVPRSGQVRPNTDDSISKTLWADHGWGDRPIVEEELYDLMFDPNEANSLADSPDCADVIEDMRTRLDKWMTATDDILLKTDPELPDGIVASPVDEYSPGKSKSVPWGRAEWPVT